MVPHKEESPRLAIRLPNAHSVRQITEAFRNAATFAEEELGRKWQFDLLTLDNVLVHPTAQVLYPRNPNAIQRRLFRKSPTWEEKQDHAMRVSLSANAQGHAFDIRANRCSEVYVSVNRNIWPRNRHETMAVVGIDPNSQEFTPYKAAYERIIRVFIEQLTSTKKSD